MMIQEEGVVVRRAMVLEGVGRNRKHTGWKGEWSCEASEVRSGGEVMGRVCER